MMIITILLSAFVSMAQANILTLPHKAVTLDNGLRVYMVKYPSPGVVSYQLPVRVGSRHEVERGKSGFAHFFEHLMFRGTKNRSAKEFGDLYARLGCENNAWTWFDMTNYHGVVASVYLPQILDAEADRFANLAFDEKALKDEAGAVLGEYNKNIAQPENVLEEKLLETAFNKHTYAHTTMGYKEDILKYTERYNDVWPFFKRYYRPSNVSIVLVGDIDFDKMLATIKTKFGSWKDPEIEQVEIPKEPEQTEPRQATVKLDKPTQTRLAVAYKIPAFTTKNKDAASLNLLAEMLFSVTSDFQKEYKFEKKWVDVVSASPLDMADPGLWTVNLRLSQAGEGKEAELLKAIEKTIAGVREEAPDAERLSSTKKRFRNSAITSWFGTPERLAGQIAWYTNFEADLGVLDRIFARLDEVTPEDLQAFAKTYLTDARKTTITLQGNGASTAATRRAGRFIASAEASSTAADYEVLLKKSADLPVTTFNLTFRVGSADDPEGAEGLAYLTARMLREGGASRLGKLPARTRAEIEDFLFPLAAEIDLSAGKEQTSFSVTSTAADAGTVFGVVSQMILAPAFDPKEFERIQAETLDALTKAMPREDQEELGKAVLDQAVWGKKHPYGHLTIGTVAAVKAATLEKVKEFYKSRFTQKRLVVGVAGVVDKKVAATARSAFAKLPVGDSARAEIPAAGEKKGLRLLLVKGPFDATGVHLGLPLPFNRADADFGRMYLASMGFGKHRSFVGRLMKVVREERGLNYGTYTYVEDFPNGGSQLMEPTQVARARQAFTLWARPTPVENGCFVLRQVHRELSKLSTEGLTEEEFKLAKSHLVGGAPLLATGIERRLGYDIDSLFYGIKGDYLSRLQSDAKAARRKNVNALLAKYVRPGDMDIVVVTPEPEKFKEQILGPRCDIKYAEGIEKSPEVIEEDKKIAVHALGLKAENISVVDSDTVFAQ